MRTMRDEVVVTFLLLLLRGLDTVQLVESKSMFMTVIY